MAINIGGLKIKYTDGGGTLHEFSNYIGTVGNSADFLADPGSNINLATITTAISVVNAGTLAAAFIKCLEFFAPTGSGITSIEADYRTDSGPGTVDGSTSYTVTNFTPVGGNPGHGPHPIGFAAFRGVSAGSNRPTWLRFYTSGDNVWGQPTAVVPSDIDAALATYLSKLASPGGNLTNWAHWSGAIDVDGTWLGSTPWQVAVGRLGCRNG